MRKFLPQTQPQRFRSLRTLSSDAPPGVQRVARLGGAVTSR